MLTYINGNTTHTIERRGRAGVGTAIIYATDVLDLDRKAVLGRYGNIVELFDLGQLAHCPKPDRLLLIAVVPAISIFNVPLGSS